MSTATDADAPATATEPGMVRLESLGFPKSVGGTAVAALPRCPESARKRLTAAGGELTDDSDESVEASVVSTRLPPDEPRRLNDDLAARVGRTSVLAHTGAERLAAELVRAGADAIVGEGNEEALVGLIDAERTPTALLASFERRFGGGSSTNVHGLDPGTGLPDRRSFERRLGGAGDAGEIPRVALLEVISGRWITGNPDAVVSVQRRRLATSLARRRCVGRRTVSTADGEFGLIGPRLSPHDTDRLGSRHWRRARPTGTGTAACPCVWSWATPDRSPPTIPRSCSICHAVPSRSRPSKALDRCSGPRTWPSASRSVGPGR